MAREAGSSPEVQPWYITAASFIPEQDAILLWQAAQHLSHHWPKAVSFLGLDKAAAERAQQAVKPEKNTQVHQQAALSVLSLWYYHCRRTMWQLLEGAMAEARTGVTSDSDVVEQSSSVRCDFRREFGEGSESSDDSLQSGHRHSPSLGSGHGSMSNAVSDPGNGYNSIGNVSEHGNGDVSISSDASDPGIHSTACQSSHHDTNHDSPNHDDSTSQLCHSYKPNDVRHTEVCSAECRPSQCVGSASESAVGSDEIRHVATAHQERQETGNPADPSPNGRCHGAANVIQYERGDWSCWHGDKAGDVIVLNSHADSVSMFANDRNESVVASSDDECWRNQKSKSLSSSVWPMMMDDGSGSEASGYQSDDESKDEAIYAREGEVLQYAQNTGADLYKCKAEQAGGIAVSKHTISDEREDSKSDSSMEDAQEGDAVHKDGAGVSSSILRSAVDEGTGVHVDAHTEQTASHACDETLHMAAKEKSSKKGRRKRRRGKHSELPTSNPVRSTDLLANRDQFSREADELQSAGMQCWKANNITAAKQKLHRAITIKKILLGEHDRQMAPLYYTMAKVLTDNLDTDAAKVYLQKAVSCLRQTSSDNELRGCVLTDLAQMCFDKRDFATAAQYGQQGAAAWQSVLNACSASTGRQQPGREGKHHTVSGKKVGKEASAALANVLTVTGKAHWEQSDLASAQSFLQRAVITLRSWWPSSSDLHHTTVMLARVLVSQGDLSGAEECFSALPFGDECLGETTLDRCHAIESMASLALHRQEPAKVVVYIRRILRLLSQDHGMKAEEAVVLAIIRQIFAYVSRLPLPNDGIVPLKQICEICEERYGATNEITGEAHAELAASQAKLGEMTEARHTYLVAVEFWERQYSSNYCHPSQQRIMQRYFAIAEQQARHKSKNIINNKMQRIVWLGEGYLEMATKKMKSHNYDLAKKYYTQGVGIFSSEYSSASGEQKKKLGSLLLSGVSLRGECNYKLGDLQQSLNDCDMVLSASSSHPRATFIRGCVLFALGQYLQSHGDFIALALLGPDETDEFALVDWLNKVRPYTAGRVDQVTRRHVPPSKWLT